MLKCYSENSYDYLYDIISNFVNWADSPLDKYKEILSSLISKDDNLSQDPSAIVPNIRILTTEGTVDIYFYSNAFDRNIPDAHSIYFGGPHRGESCLIFAVDGDYIDLINFDLHSAAEVIDNVIPQFTNHIWNAVCSKEE